MQEHFLAAARTDPQHRVLIKNVERARAWFREQGPARGLPLELEVCDDFQLLERTLQPTLPGPLADDWNDFDASPRPVPSGMPSSAEVTEERYGKQGFPNKRLRVLA